MGELVASGNVSDCTAIGDEVACELPSLAKHIVHQVGMRAAWLAVDAIVSAHNGFHFCFGDELLERRQVGIVQVAHRHTCIKSMAQLLRAAVYREVLGAGSRLEVSWVVALQAAYKGCANFARKVRVFAIGFLAPPPAWVAEDVDVWRPEIQSLVLSGLSLAAKGCMVLGPPFIANRRGDPLNEGNIPAGCQADGLGKDGRAAIAGDAMQGFAPIVISWQAKPGDSRRIVHQLADFFGAGHAGNQILYPLGIGAVIYPGKPVRGVNWSA